MWITGANMAENQRHSKVSPGKPKYPQMELKLSELVDGYWFDSQNVTCDVWMHKSALSTRQNSAPQLLSKFRGER